MIIIIIIIIIIVIIDVRHSVVCPDAVARSSPRLLHGYYSFMYHVYLLHGILSSRIYDRKTNNKSSPRSRGAAPPPSALASPLGFITIIISLLLLLLLLLLLASRPVVTYAFLTFCPCVFKQNMHLAYTRCSFVRNMCFA